MHSRTHWFVVAATTVVAGSALLTAGPINPPTGPIVPGGKTTQELYDAITGISNVAVSGRSPAVPGFNYTAGTFTLNTSPPISGTLLGLRHSLSTSYGVTGGSYALSSSTFGNFTIMRELGTSSSATYKAATISQAFSSATITVPSAGGNTVYTLTFCYIVGLRQYDIQRADGTYAVIEELDLLANSVKVADPSGTPWTYNYITHTGS